MFNFYRVFTQAPLDCMQQGILACDPYAAKREAAKCPSDYVIVMHSRSKTQNLASPIRSSSRGTLVSLNAADDKAIFIHEFGHAFGELGDEYVDERYYSAARIDPLDYPNCDRAPCARWSGMNATGCYSGCMLGAYSRPTADSVMRSPYRTTDFGAFNEQELMQHLARYGGER
ncbi:hypothetical protein COY28_00305 [Candidatus Woesearchaeota archaeon CG_4_10_14_0_2_um_filter_57_5]|nr:MAG: hypothetical protein COY28_00305 [Candidatus Woesearchaeota archaeon CG_4_10_14_0_2_um_filter_57_5]